MKYENSDKPAQSPNICRVKTPVSALHLCSVRKRLRGNISARNTNNHHTLPKNIQTFFKIYILIFHISTHTYPCRLPPRRREDAIHPVIIMIQISEHMRQVIHYKRVDPLQFMVGFAQFIGAWTAAASAWTGAWNSATGRDAQGVDQSLDDCGFATAGRTGNDDTYNKGRKNDFFG